MHRSGLGRPSQRVVSICGDGGFLMNGMEVSTAVNYGIPVVWVVFNDQRLGMVCDGHRAICGRDAVGMEIRGADFVKIAEGLGARAFAASTGDEFRVALRAALAIRGPVVIDVRIDPTAVPPVPFLRPELAREL
jgi:acetolactate synthase-1/2/3 large subunit